MPRWILATFEDKTTPTDAEVEERLPTEDHVIEVIKRAMTGACPHGKRKLGPCRMCVTLRCRSALLALRRERLEG